MANTSNSLLITASVAVECRCQGDERLCNIAATRKWPEQEEEEEEGGKGEGEGGEGESSFHVLFLFASALLARLGQVQLCREGARYPSS